MAKTSQQQHQDILTRFDRAYTPQQAVRAKCVEAARFARVPGGQWEGATSAGTKLGDQFEKYPKFEVNKVASELNRIIGEYRNNRITVNFRPGDRAASDGLATKLNGLFRADYQDTDGGEACDNAFDDAATGGFGCFRLTTQYVNELDPSDESQRICLEPIYDPARSVWFDPDAKTYDKSDAQWAFCMYSLSVDKYKEEYDKDPASMDMRMISPQQYDWFTNDIVYIAKYYEVRKENATLISYQNPITGEIATYDMEQVEGLGSALEESAFVELARRKIKKRRVYVSIVDGDGFLEKATLIPGEHIPLVPVYGKRWFIDDVERVEGHVAKAMDPQRLYNMQVSMLADASTQDPGMVPILDMDQVRGLESHWADRNRKRPAFLPLRSIKDKSGNIVQPANAVGYTQPPAINQAQAALLQMTSADIQEVTGASQAMQQMPSNIAEETVNKLMHRSDMSSFIYLDNMAKSLKRAGEIWLSMAREIYGSEREVRIANEDGSDELVTLVDEVLDTNTGQSVALNDLSSGKYDVTVDTGPSYTTRRDATVSSLTNLLQGMLPEDPMRQVIMGIIIDNVDGEGLDDFKEYNRKSLLQQGVVKPRNEQEAQILQQMQQQVQEPSPDMVAAMAQDKLAQAELVKAQTDAANMQIKAFTAQNQAVESTANTALKLAQAEDIKHGALMDAFKLVADFVSQQQQEVAKSSSVDSAAIV